MSYRVYWLHLCARFNMPIETIHTFFPLIASLSAMGLSQTIKCIIMMIRQQKMDMTTLTRSGGMPSSHSALITAITLSIGLKDGFHSSYFFLAIAFSLVVIYDARGIRHTVGKHATLLNQTLMSSSSKKLNESIGHTLPEIIAGISIGIIISLGLYNMLNV